MTLRGAPRRLPEELVVRAREHADGTRETAVARDAATVLLLREAATPGAGPEVYYLLRQTSMSFAAGMAVYPGGGVDPRDFQVGADADVAWAGPDPAQWAERLDTDVHRARALVCAAVRETFEESGVLLAGSSAGDVVADTTTPDWEADRRALETRELALGDLLARRGLRLRSDLLGVWDAWETPAFEPRRYRTWFFVARLPHGQVTRDVSLESSSVTWLTAGEAVRLADAGELGLMPPTYLTSLEVAGFEGPDAVLAAAAERRAVMFTPYVVPLDAGDETAGSTLAVPDRLRGLVGRS